MSVSRPTAWLRSQFPTRPHTAPDFLLSRPHGSVRTQGVRDVPQSIATAATALRTGDAEMVVGALPFDPEQPAALTIPERIVREPGILHPHPYYLSGPGAGLSARVAATDPDADEHRERVARAVAAIRAGQAKKIVLARAVDIEFAAPVDPLLVAARLIATSANHEGFIADLSPAGESFAGRMLVGASPEVLVHKAGTTVTAYPLAGSAPRKADASADAAAARALAYSGKDRAEHAFVVDHLRQALAPLCCRLAIPSEPELTQTNEVWHLATPITGELDHKHAGLTALELAQLVHPTPAICGTPTARARDYILGTESPRGFYAGAVGWADSSGDGEFMVAIRCADVAADGLSARTWAGGGIVADSDPAVELAETTAKLGTMMRALGIENSAAAGLA